MWKNLQSQLEKSPRRLFAVLAVFTITLVLAGPYLFRDQLSELRSNLRKPSEKSTNTDDPGGPLIVSGTRRADRIRVSDGSVEGSKNMPTYSPVQDNTSASGTNSSVGSQSPSIDRATFDGLVMRGFEQFKRFKIYHNNPDTLPWGKPTKLVFSVGSHNPIAARDAADREYGALAVADVDLGMRVRAELSGSVHDVEIQMIGPGERTVSTASNTTWEWYVVPNKTEDFQMIFRLYNLQDVAGKQVETEGPAYTHTFKVKVTLVQRIKIWLENLSFLFGLLGVSIIGSIIFIRGWLFKKYPQILRFKPNVLNDRKGRSNNRP